ncbi:MAG: tRNA uridine-5-carboxymethylaminomethyl(34) synthesis GTPase MnmE [Clostridiales bacterium]|nr:tRNA uridine-5-carboxymethylaminomethyl(34) synthesis GTPase MnmE [Clostridiales bacterium]
MFTVAAIATPCAASGIGVIRISGDDALLIADRVFSPFSPEQKLSEMKGYSAAYGRVISGGRVLDKAVALVFRAPKSYTGENVAELSCHGSPFVLQQVLRAVLEAGAQPAPAGEFTKRAYLNGKLDLASAEAVMNVISSQGEDARSAALNALDGALGKKAEAVRGIIVSAAANMSAWVDYPDEEIPELDRNTLTGDFKRCEGELRALLSGFDAGQAVLGGVDTVIAGRPNAGKSTLMNLLAGRELSIVTPVAGTTRDVVEQTVRVGNTLLKLADTAGLRAALDEVEKIGVERAKTRIERAGLVLAVFDSAEELNADDFRLAEMCTGKKAVAVINKTDLPPRADLEYIKSHFEYTAQVSASEAEGMETLESAIEALLGTKNFDTSCALLTTERQRACCEKAAQCLSEAVEALESGMTLDAVNVSCDGAIAALLELTGESVSEAVVNEVFAQFCVGK